MKSKSEKVGEEVRTRPLYILFFPFRLGVNGIQFFNWYYLFYVFDAVYVVGM
jgi:hypothetical protein